MSTEENNSLIAEFMGCEKEVTLEDEIVYAIKWDKHFPHTDKTSGLDVATEFYYPSELEYNSNPIWLRNVRIKTEALGENIDARHHGKMYRDIITFIKQYNEKN